MFLRKYGTGTGADVIIPIIKRGVVDFAVSADWTPASGDVKVSKDGGTEANITTLPVINGTTGWKFVFSDAELQCKSLTVRIVDSATKAIEDQFFIVETYGHASAMFQSDLAAAQLPANVTHFGGSAGTFASGRPEVNTTHWGGTTVGSANVLIDGAITAAKIATDAITAAKIAADAVAEIQAGLSTLDAAGVRTSVGLATANLDTQLSGISTKTANLPSDPADASDIAASFSTVNSTLATIAGYIDTEVSAIKAKTDNLPTDPADASDIAAAFATVNSTLATIAGYLDTEIAAIKAKTDNLPASPASETTLSALSGKLAGITLLRNWLALIMGKAADTTTRAEVNATTAGATFNETTDSLEAIRDRGDAAWTTGSGGGGGSGTGARTVTITVNDGTTALQNARVRLTEGANTFTAQTNSSGLATFNVDDATYTVAITKAGYSYSGTTLAVSASTSVTYSMTATTITPSTGDQTTGYLTTLDETGQAEANVSIYVSVADVPNDYGLALDEATRTVVSDEDGLVEITGMVKGATYNLRRGLKGRLFTVTIPTSAGSTYELPNMAGV